MNKNIYIVNGINYCDKQEYINNKLNDENESKIIIQDNSEITWYEFLDKVEKNLIYKTTKNLYLDCFITSRLRLNQLLDAITAVQECAKDQYNIYLIVIGAKKNKILENIKKEIDSNSSLISDLTEYYFTQQEEILNLMKSVEYYKFPLKFIELEEFN